MAETVYLILDRNYGENILQLGEDTIIWACASDQNKAFGDRLREISPRINLTLFDINDMDTERDMCDEFISTIIKHHPACTKIDVRAESTEGCESLFQKFGYDKFVQRRGQLLAIKT